MTQRIHDRLKGEFSLDNEILVRAIRTGEYTDQFSAHFYPKNILTRLPKCMLKEKKGRRKDVDA